MTLHHDRIAILMARCSEGAYEHLVELKGHEKFLELVVLLEGVGGHDLSGRLLESDVEQLFREVLIQHPNKKWRGSVPKLDFDSPLLSLNVALPPATRRSRAQWRP